MAYANGVFSRLYSWVTDRDGGIKVRADRMDAEMDGIKNALNEITAGTVQMIGSIKGYDGTVSAPGYGFNADTNTGLYRIGTDNLGVALAGVKHMDLSTTGVALLEKGAPTSSGTDTITLTWPVVASALASEQRIVFKAGGTNTGAATLNLNSLGAKAVRKISGGTDIALSAGDITVGNYYTAIYDAAANSAAGAWVLSGSASVAAATTSAAGIVELATAAEALAASSSALALTPASIATLIQNINNNAFEIADLKGTRLNMAGGIADAYDSETDVDTATSTNEAYDATNDLYAPSATAASPVSGATGTILTNLTDIPTTPFNGTTSKSDGVSSYRLSTGADGALIGKDWGLGNTKTIYGFDLYGSNNSGLWASSTSNTVKLQGSTDNFASSVVTLWTGTVTDANGLVAAITSGITTTTAYRYHRLAISGNGAETVYVAQVVFYDAAAVVNNMTLVSNAFTATAVPTQARVAVFIDPQVSITINTDFTAEVSRDGGTTWTAVTLALVSNPVGTVEQYEGTVSISSQPSGTSMKYRLKTLNNKDIDVTGIVFQWS